MKFNPIADACLPATVRWGFVISNVSLITGTVFPKASAVNPNIVGMEFWFIVAQGIANPLWSECLIGIKLY